MASQRVEVKFLGMLCLNQTLEKFYSEVPDDFYKSPGFLKNLVTLMVEEPNALVQREYSNCINFVAKI